ncbi:MAG: type IX secretion system membrane protein PorP/SprF [Flavobacteriales bacterium]|nr:type IX secretion system membrane protein PorP/SprF [Flavobacteriales bacterium]
MNKWLSHLPIIFSVLPNKIGWALFILPFFLFNLEVSAQQEPLFSQYMFNKLIVNPGYAGSSGMLNASLAYRQKFIGLEGAPKIQGLTIHAPFKTKSMGFGIKAIHESLGVTSQNEVSAIYAYHLDLAKGRLSLGAEGGIFNQSIDFNNLRKTIQDDNALPVGKESLLVPDAAFGLYYSSEKFYVGGALYHLLQNELNYSGYTGKDRTLIAKLSSHSYVLGGYKFKARDNIRVEPSLLFKYVAGVPLQIDMNVNVTFKEVFTIGGTFRTKNAIVFLFQYSFKDRLKFGYAYDYIFSGLSSSRYSSHGIMLSYNIPTDKKASDVEKEEEMVPEILSATDSLSVADSLSAAESLSVADSLSATDSLSAAESLSADSSDVSVSSLTKDTVKVIEPALVETPDLSPTRDTSKSDSVVTIEEKDKPIVDDPISKKEEGFKSQESPRDVVIVEPDRKSVTFKIQLLAKKEPVFVTPVNFNGMENVEEYQEGDLYKYVVGVAYDYDYAKDVLLDQVKRQGYKDAFIVAYTQDKRISIKEALKLLKQ